MYRVLDPANAAFVASAGTITFTTEVPASLSHVRKVTNLTRGEVLFDPTGDSGPGYMQTATYAAGVLTLGVPTHDHANNDKLFIEYDDGEGAGGGGGSGHSSAQLAELEAINADLGAPADAAATSDTGTFGVIPLLKRGLQNWTTLLARIPALVNGAIPTAPNVQQGGGAITASTTRVTMATDGPGVTALTSIDGKTLGALTPTTASVASSATSVTVLAANAANRKAVIYNDSTALLRLSFSTPATAANAFVTLQPGGFVDLGPPDGCAQNIYGIWASANGTAQVTRFV